MVDEYIRKADAVSIAESYEVKRDGFHLNDYEYGRNQVADSIASDLEDMPLADVVPVRHGTWLPIVSYNNTYKCSECGRLLVDITDGLKMVAKNYPYCHCGAKMDGKREE